MQITNQKVFGIYALACLGAYITSLNGPFIFDDIHTVVANHGIRNFDDLRSVFFSDSPTRPFLFVTFAINYMLGGLNPIGYHLGNYIIHILSAWAVFHLIKELMRLDGVDNDLYPFFGGLLFLLHPMQVDAVAYVASRSSSLSTMLYLFAFLIIVKRPAPTILTTLGAGVAMALALLTKELAISLPALAVIFYLQYPEKGGLKKNANLLILLWSLIPLYFFFRTTVTGYLTEKVDPERTLNSVTYFYTQLGVVAFEYIPRLFVPVMQIFDAENFWKETIFHPVVLGGGLVFVLLAWFALSRFKSHRTPSFAIIWFVTALSVTSSFIPIIDAYVERRLYVAMPAFALLIAYCLYYFSAIRPDRIRKVKIGFIAVLTVFFCLTAYRSSIYSDPLALWQDTAEKAWAKQRVFPHVAYQLFIRGKNEEAKSFIRYSLQKFPDHPPLQILYAWILTMEGQFGPLEVALQQIKPERAEDFVPYYAMYGILEGQKGNFEKSQVMFKKSLALNPTYSFAVSNYSILLSKFGKINEALAVLREGVRIDPWDSEYHYRIGLLLIDLDRPEAIKELRRAQELSPEREDVKQALASMGL